MWQVKHLDKLRNLVQKYRSILSYAFFGLCTTVVNVIVYDVLYNRLQVSNIVSTIIAWVIAVIFAFITNKVFVFDSKSFEWKKLRYELITFLSCRLLTGILDIGIMFVAVDLMSWNGVFWKIISNILVIILNYAASKLVIFKK